MDGFCAIPSEALCESVATALNLVDRTATVATSNTRVAGCYLAGTTLQFNLNMASTAEARATDANVCFRCTTSTTTTTMSTTTPKATGGATSAELPEHLVPWCRVVGKDQKVCADPLAEEESGHSLYTCQVLAGLYGADSVAWSQNGQKCQVYVFVLGSARGVHACARGERGRWRSLQLHATCELFLFLAGCTAPESQ